MLAAAVFAALTSETPLCTVRQPNMPDLVGSLRQTLRTDGVFHRHPLSLAVISASAENGAPNIIVSAAFASVSDDA